MLKKISEAESGVHTVSLSHGEVHTSEGEQDPEQPELLPPSDLRISWSHHAWRRPVRIWDPRIPLRREPLLST